MITAPPIPPTAAAAGAAVVLIGESWWQLAVAAGFALVAALYAAPYVPTHDGPHHVYLAPAE